LGHLVTVEGHEILKSFRFGELRTRLRRGVPLDQLEKTKAALQAAMCECTRLQEENVRLMRLLLRGDEHGTATTPDRQNPGQRRQPGFCLRT
jgi:hypothetical protein